MSIFGKCARCGSHLLNGHTCTPSPLSIEEQAVVGRALLKSTKIVSKGKRLKTMQGDHLIRLTQVKTLVNISKSQIYILIRRGQFPKPYTFGRASLWSYNEIQKWIESVKKGATK